MKIKGWGCHNSRRVVEFGVAFGLGVLLVSAILFSQVTPVMAAATFSITPITWNVVGLDSNNVNVGPNNFPVGVRVCNTGDAVATNLSASFVWDTSNTYINLRSGSQNPITWSSLGVSACHDFYFEVTVTRDANAYNTARRYHITVTADAGVTATSTTPREIFVEHLISQNRNATTDVKLDGVSIPIGGAMSLIVGNTYNITLNASTATQGYEQIESFINFPNTIFRINSVTTTYSANAGTDSLAGIKLYANGCNWENNPNSPNYRSCYSTGKYGGTVTVVYNVTIIGGGGSSQTLSTLIYDFSGSSYHYNSDFVSSVRYATIVGPANMTIGKRFVPDSILPGGVSQLIFTIPNTNTISISGVQFTDGLPSGVSVAGTPGISYSGCGSGAFSPVPTSGATSLTFQNATIAPNSSCVIKINVTASGLTTYNNTTGNLFINTTTNTGNTGSASLTVANAPACTPGQTMANWTMPSTMTNPPDTAGGIPAVKASNVATATASAFIPANTAIVSNSGVNDSYSWSSWGYKNSGQVVSFTVDTRHYSNVTMSFAVKNDGLPPGPTALTLAYNNGSGFTNIFNVTNPAITFVTHTVDFSGLTSLTGTTNFRLTATGATNDNQGAGLNYDNVKFSGCSNLPPPPTISKIFSPTTIPTNTVTTLTFTISNTQTANEPLTNVTFSDPLPAGLEVASSPSSGTSGAGCTGITFNPSAGATTLTYTANNMTAGAICTAQVNIKPTRAGTFDNVSGYIGSTESGQNKTSTGYATASLTAIAPPSIAKIFAASPVYVSATTVLSFTLTNPNQSTGLTGVQFSDTLPAGVTVATTSTSQCGGTLNTTNPSTIALTNGSIAANGSCSFGVTVTGATQGVYTNTTGAVSSTNGGTGNTASAPIQVKTLSPSISLRKQAGPTASGPWTTFVTRTVGQDVYFRFLVENTGDTTLTSIAVNEITTPLLDMSGCTFSSLNVYTYTACIAGPVTVTNTNWTTNTAQATSASATSLNSSASFWSRDPTAVLLSSLGAYSADANSTLLVFVAIGAIIASGAMIVIARKHK